MARIEVTIIDVGHGDCIFIEATKDNGAREFAVIDCPDTINLQPGMLFIKRRIERLFGAEKHWPKPIFEFVLMSHAHADHCDGLPRLISKFGTKLFYHGRVGKSVSAAHVFRSVRHWRRSIGIHQLNSATALPFSTIGNANLNVLFPDPGPALPNENDNSVVVTIEHDGFQIILTGDIEVGCWSAITMPSSIHAIKAPHHGAANGTIDSKGISPWLGYAYSACIAVSCHTVPHTHPDVRAIAAMKAGCRDVYRTDEHGNITFCVESGVLSVKCWQ